MDTTLEGGPIRTYAQPLSGLRISWGAVLAGAVTFGAVTLILWSLAWAITFSAGGSFAHLRGVILALMITLWASTLIGGFVGGLVAGYLPGHPLRRIGALHGFIAWGVAFVFMSMVLWGIIGGLARTATGAATNTVGNVAGGQMTMSRRAENLLTSLGYTAPQARSMVTQGQSQVQGLVQGRGGARNAVRSFGQTVFDWTAGLSWAWWAVWLATGFLATLGGALGVPGEWERRRAARAARAPVRRPLPTEPHPA